MAHIHSSACVDEGAHIGDGTHIWHFAHIRGGAVIGRDCNLGKDVYVDAGVTIGDRCKIQNGVSIYHGVTIGDEVFVGPNVTFTNDRFPRAVGAWTVSPTVIRHGASIGAGAILVAGITIGEYAMIGAGAVVTRSVPPHALVYGNPAATKGWVCRYGHRVRQYSLVFNCPQCKQG